MKHKTAITRKRPSAPMLRLALQGKIVGRALDYGCGKGMDAREFETESYDPHFQPVMPDGEFDTITCNYVLNVIESETEREEVLQDIRNRLAPGGIAYVTVRTDKAQLTGRTSIGTWQGLVELDLPIVNRGSGYKTYEVR